MKWIRLLLIAFIFWNFSLLQADPWGKDADLCVRRSATVCKPCPQSWLAQFGERAIRFHQDVISPADGPRSHFIPSSSQYTLDAMRQYGFFAGFFLGCDRLMRENSEEWIYPKVQNDAGYTLKWDPIP